VRIFGKTLDKMLRTLSYCFLLLMLFSGCLNDDDSCPRFRLPSATTEGGNIYGCYVNEDLFVHYKRPKKFYEDLYIPSLWINYSRQHSFLSIIATKRLPVFCDSTSQSMTFTLVHNDSLGVEQFNLTYSSGIPGTGRYKLDSLETVNLEILRFDTLARVFSAKFNVTVSLEDKSDYKVISDGRLDIKY
jgi:hypothetical protein